MAYGERGAGCDKRAACRSSVAAAKKKSRTCIQVLLLSMVGHAKEVLDALRAASSALAFGILLQGRDPFLAVLEETRHLILE
jgi:hypothetical protein